MTTSIFFANVVSGANLAFMVDYGYTGNGGASHAYGVRLMSFRDNGLCLNLRIISRTMTIPMVR